jgi:multicomponent Na+:H+ antiporter subunit E
MNNLLLNILLAIAWVMLTGEFGWQPLIEGMVIGYVILGISRYALGSYGYFQKIPKAIGFFFYFIKELIIANIVIAYDILTPTDHMKPGIVAIPLDAKTDLEITLLANFITLTPGTLSLDVSTDKKTLYVHGIYVKDADRFRASIKPGFEKRLLELLR